MKKLFVIAALATLTACGETAEETTPVVATETAVDETDLDEAAALPAPDQAVFAAVFAKTCPAAEPVSTSVCRRAMGADTVSCEFGIGEDEYMRHDAELTAEGDNWTLADAEQLCANHDSHHVDL